jgi:hypothetical protein
MAAAAHPPTRDSPEPRPLARAAVLPLVAGMAAMLFPPLDAEPPREGAGRKTPGGARSPGQRAFARVRPGSTCARPYWIACPSHCLGAEAAGKGRGREQSECSPSSAGARQPSWPEGKAGWCRGSHRPRLTTPAGLGSLSPRHTPPR